MRARGKAVLILFPLFVACSKGMPSAKSDAGPLDGAAAVDASVDGGPSTDGGPFLDGGLAGASCQTSADCASNLSCLSGTCHSTDDTGIDCRDKGCQSGICLGSASVCTTPCHVDADCPAGWTCGDQAGQSGKICTCQKTALVCDGKDHLCEGHPTADWVTTPWCQLNFGPAEVCHAGACECPAATCGGKCTDTSTDPDNCGGCGMTCGSGRICSLDTCRDMVQTVMPSQYSEPTQLVVDTNNIYWLDEGWATVDQQPLAGGGVVTVASALAPYLDWITVQNGNVFWDDEGIFTTPIGGGAKKTIVAGQTIGPPIAIDSANAYWLAIGNRWLVMKQPLNGGQAEQVADFTPPPGERLNDKGADGMAVESGYLYWFGNDGLLSVPVTGGTPALISGPARGGPPGEPSQIIADATGVYWPNTSSTGAVVIEKTPLLGGTSTIVTSLPAAADPQCFAQDDQFLYWLDLNGVIEKAPKSGGEAQVLLRAYLQDGVSNLGGIAIGGTSLYFSNLGGIWQLTPR